MTDSSDDNLDMTISFLSRRNGLDDQSLDALFGADSTSPAAQFEGVGMLLTDLRTLIDAPPPPPNTELAEMMARGLPAASGDLAQSLSARRTAKQRLRRTGLALGLSAAVALPLAGVAAAKDLLPTWMDDAITSVIEAITPFHLSDRATGSEGNPGYGPSDGETKVIPGRQGPNTAPTQQPGGAASQGTGTSRLPKPVDSTTPTGAKTLDQTGSGTTTTTPPTSTTSPTAGTTSPTTSTTSPTAGTTGPTTSTTSPTAGTTGPTTSTTRPTAGTTSPAPTSTTRPTAGTTSPAPTSTTSPTAGTTSPAPSSTGPTTTFSPGAVVLGPGAPTTTNAPKVSAPALGFTP